jgi:hypothetical protein
MANYLDRHLVRPVTVHARYAAGQDEHGNEVYAEHVYDSHCYCQIQSRIEAPDGRSSDQMYLVLLPAADVLAHPSPGGMSSLNTFAWLDIDGMGRLEVDGDPAYWRALRDVLHPHHVEVLCRRSSTTQPL